MASAQKPVPKSATGSVPSVAKSDIKVIVDHLVRPLQDAADALAELTEVVDRWVKLEELRFAKENPHIEIRPVTVGVAKYANPVTDKPEEEGDVFPGYIGPREAKLLARQQKQAKRSIAPPRSRS
jgi:hypothetical protein